MESYKFFDSTSTDERTYNADKYAEYFRALIEDGVQFADGNDLSVTNTGGDMISTINSGSCFIQGYQYILTGTKDFIHDNPDATYHRIDRIVLRLDTNIDKRYIQAVLIKGTPSATPTPPELTQDLEGTGIHEYPLAQMLITAGQAFIGNADITIESNYAKIVNPLYRQVFISNAEPNPTHGKDGDIFIKY